MRYHRSSQYRNADATLMGQFVGLKSKSMFNDEERPHTIDERDARLIVANLRKKEYPQFKSEFAQKSYAPFRLLQDFEYKRKKGGFRI